MYLRLTIVSAIILALGVLIGFVGFPMLVKKMIKKQVNLKPGSEIRKMWEKFPIAVNFSVNVFNVTNPDVVQAGGKPILQEVGPFVFEEWKDKYDLEDHEEEDAVSFNMRNTFIFRPDLGLSGEEIITMPHPLIQIMAIAVKRDKQPMLPIISQGIEAIFKPTTPFVTAPFMDLFYRGIDIDCSNENFAARAICVQFHMGEVKGGVKYNETLFKFSLMGASNHTDAGRFKVARGVRDSHDIAKVLQFNEEDELNVWNGDECNRFHGTDSTMFAPLLKLEEGLWAFSGDLCRSLGAIYAHKTTYDGIPAFRYKMDLGDPKNEPENQCFCKDYPDNCPAKGTMDLSPCNEAPMIVSLPHFFTGDPKLLADVDGLNPTEAKHGIFIDFEIISGTPVSAAKRLQFNLDVEPVAEVECMKDLRPLVMPLFWVEEAANLDKTYTDQLKKKVFLIFKINNAFKWIATICGAFGCAIGGYMLSTRKRDENRIQTVAPTATKY